MSRATAYLVVYRIRLRVIPSHPQSTPISRPRHVQQPALIDLRSKVRHRACIVAPQALDELQVARVDIIVVRPDERPRGVRVAALLAERRAGVGELARGGHEREDRRDRVLRGEEVVRGDELRWDGDVHVAEPDRAGGRELRINGMCALGKGGGRTVRA